MHATEQVKERRTILKSKKMVKSVALLYQTLPELPTPYVKDNFLQTINLITLLFSKLLFLAFNIKLQEPSEFGGQVTISICQ
jgi:hypothetical protein